MENSSNKTIAKNTFFLYFRMILVMGVSLYTSRIVLRELGVTDYGIYSIVGGFISLFGFLNAAMSSATQRYLTFDLGKNDLKRLSKTFSTTLTIHGGIALLVLIIAETIGLWYVNNIMVFPNERTFAVNFVYQFSIASSLLGIIQVPYNALIIAHERMNIYAYVSIVEVVLKLVVVFILIFVGNDKIIIYSILTFIVALGIRLFYQYYCRKNFKESNYKFVWDRKYYGELISYSSWNLLGNIAVAAKGQGSNVLLNLFFGTTVNAAYGIMNIVNSAINNLINSFQTASNPQIIKLYSSSNILGMQNLMNKTSKFSFYLCLLLIAPIFLNIEYILNIWLENPPEFAGAFIQLALITSLIDTLSKPIMTGITATGRIKIYHVVIGSFNILILPVSYLLLKIVNSPQIIMFVWVVFAFISLLFRLFFVKKIMNYNLKVFISEVLFRVFLISVLSLAIGILLNYFVQVDSFILLIFQSLIFCGFIMIFIFYLGIKISERNALTEFIKKYLMQMRNFKYLNKKNEN